MRCCPYFFVYQIGYGGSWIWAIVRDPQTAKFSGRVAEALLKEQYEEINYVMQTVQTALDKKRGLHIAPQKADLPFERIKAAAYSLVDATATQEDMIRRAGAAPVTVVRSYHDQYIADNAQFRSDAGLKCYLVRTTDGNCCKWCSRLAGRYEYGEHPEDIFRRHDNCGCTVTYENGRQRQDVWSKKKWEAPEAEAGAPKPTVLNYAEGKAIQAKNTQYRGLTSKAENGRINYAKPLEMFNYSDIPSSEVLTPNKIINELNNSNIGKEILQVIETLPEPIKFTYGEHITGVRGKEERGQITIYLNNCKDVTWAARSLIHECTHYRYGIGQSQWAECVCVAQELKHARGRDQLTREELKTIIRAVKSAYPEHKWKKVGL